MSKVRITYKKSALGARPEHRQTIKALGLSRVGQTIEKEATAPIKGMIKSVEFLLKVEELAS